MKNVMPFLLAMGVFAQALCASAAPFSFQGRLNSSSIPASGSHDFKMRLYTAETGGSQVGPELTKTATVDGGLFTVSLDFGDTAFDGGARWLEIEVRASGGGGYTLLSPRQTVAAAPYALHAVESSALTGTAHVTVQTVASATENAANLLAAYARAKTLTPNGQPLSTTNRAVVLVSPGRYDMGTGCILMDTEYVDLVGLSGDRANQYILGASNGPNTGVLRQTANDVHIANLTVACTYPGNAPMYTATPSDPAAYYPDSGTAATVVTNCDFPGILDGMMPGGLSTRPAIEYAGKYVNCSGGYLAFGGYSGGKASGTFTDCSGGQSAFGYISSGTFTNCTARGNAFGSTGNATGTYIRCSAGGASFNSPATGGGKFYYCRAAGGGSFGNATVKLYCTMNDVVVP